MKKLRTIIVPQITMGFIALITGILWSVVFIHRDTWSSFDYINCFNSWFLIVLFLMYACIWWVVKLAKTKVKIICSMIIIIIVFLLVSWNEIYYLQQTLCALVFGLLGYTLRPCVDKYSNLSTITKGVGFAVLMIISIYATKQDQSVLMYINRYGYKPVFLLVALLGIIAITDISCCLKYQRFVQWIGRNSITIYITHFTLIWFMSGILSRIPYPLHIYDNSFFLFLLIVTMEIPIIQIVNKYCPQIVGKRGIC